MIFAQLLYDLSATKRFFNKKLNVLNHKEELQIFMKRTKYQILIMNHRKVRSYSNKIKSNYQQILSNTYYIILIIYVYD